MVACHDVRIRARRGGHAVRCLQPEHGQLRGVFRRQPAELVHGAQRGQFLQNRLRQLLAAAQIGGLLGVPVPPEQLLLFKGGQLGVDAVGMSTVVEAIAANHMGMRICCISCVCNLAAGMTDNPLTHEEVQEAANAAAPLFRTLVTESVKKFGEKIL